MRGLLVNIRSRRVTFHFAVTHNKLNLWYSYLICIRIWCLIFDITEYTNMNTSFCLWLVANTQIHHGEESVDACYENRARSVGDSVGDFLIIRDNVQITMDLLLLRGSLKISVQYHSRLEMSTKNVIKWADSLSRFNGTTAKFLTDKSWVIHLLISFMGNHENLLIYAQQNRNTQECTWTILDWIDAWSMLNKIETRKYVHELFSIELTN